MTLFDFNAYSSLLLPAFIHGMLFSVLCFYRYGRERRLHDVFLGILLILLAIRLSFWMLGFAGWYDRHDGFTSFMFYFPFNTIAWVGPCLYFYFLSLTNRDFKRNKKHLPHLILPVLLLLLYIIKFVVDFCFYRPFQLTETYQFGTRGPLAQLDKTDAVYLIAYASLLGYLLLILQKFKAYRVYLIQNFSASEPINLNWLRNLVGFTLLAGGLMFGFFILNSLMPHLSYGFNWYPYFFLGIVIYYTGINGYANSPALFRYVHFEPPSTSITAEPLSGLEEWKIRLQNLVEGKQLYLNSELNLAMLAERLETHPQIISKIINDGFGMNFNDYINKLRIIEVTRQLNKDAHLKYSLMGIAYNCGFNAKTTFNRAFKKFTGCTPSDYIRDLQVPDDQMKP